MNWYKKADKLEERPYNVYRIGGGQPITKLNIPHIFAVSPEHARTMAMKKYPALLEFVSGCLRRNEDCDIQVRLDKGKWMEILNYRKLKGEKEEEKVQEAWWNK
jgi:hypothetical protein